MDVNELSANCQLARCVLDSFWRNLEVHGVCNFIENPTEKLSLVDQSFSFHTRNAEHFPNLVTLRNLKLAYIRQKLFSIANHPDLDARKTKSNINKFHGLQP